MEIEFVGAQIPPDPTTKYLIVDLFGNNLLITVNNFLKICDPTYIQTSVTDTSLKLDYKGSKLFRVVKNLGIFGGDIIKNDGTSGESIYGMVFRDENFAIMHDSRYLISATKPLNTPHTTNSQFMITLGALPWLDFRYQVFGRIRSTSRSLVDYIEFFAGTTDWDKKELPFYDVRIKNCYLTAPA
ncbi:hypothetical protein FGO68_gene17652 [Halteria grandinella]|uniref:PPIase cyclophilin-type domain-containing protein n=1 Tax=Halteria grandinella TaxID=5974 RepID=A0A8J8NJE5_HALGN|nr:hypothetical protein FGO68_gene17652 [Halteria grandinella]